jgi:glycosyltransferase involved in cell wall biosynthesis
MLPLWGRIVTIPLYWYDWFWHTRYVDLLYIPSMRMEKCLPVSRGHMVLKALPPGADIAPSGLTNTSEPIPGKLRVLYVGGVEPPTYDLSPMLNAIKQSPSTDLTICCREAEWKKHRTKYQGMLSNRVRIVHASGPDLAKLYALSDVHAIIRNSTDYLDFAVPVKVFEAVSYQTPIIVTPGTETARIVEAHGLGWACPLERMPYFLEELAHNLDKVRSKRATIKNEINNLSWQARVRQIVHDITNETI